MTPDSTGSPNPTDPPIGPVLVTGGSRGIGRAVVESLVRRGVAVAFTYRSDELAARELEAASGGRARAFSFSLADRARPATLIADVEAALGPLFGLVNNAGVRKDASLAFSSDADIDLVIDADLGGTLRLTRAAITGMVVRRAGSIVNVSSLSALHGVAGQSVYAAAKAGVIGFTRALARELGKRGVRVNAVAPGFVPTDFTLPLPEAAVKALRASECLPSGVSAAQVAGAIEWLLLPESGAVTGQVVTVDAGSSA